MRYRGWIAAGLVALLVSSFLSGAHKGGPVVVAARELQAGHRIGEADLAQAWLESPLSSKAIAERELVVGRLLNSSLPAGAVILKSQLGLQKRRVNSLLVSLPLESGDDTAYAIGSSVHVWALSDSGAWLLSEEAQVMGRNADSGRVLLALPKSAEAAAMNALAVRLAVVGG